MKGIDRRLHPSLPDESDGGPATSHRQRRRPGSWCRRRREMLMLTCIGTLTVLLLLAKAPLGDSFFGSGKFSAYVSSSSYFDEPLPLITAHENRPDTPQRPAARFLPNEVLPESDLLPDELTEIALDRPGFDAPIAPQRAAAMASLSLHDLSNTSRYMHTAIRAPVADDPPKLRMGSMLIEYPRSALKKAIEGMVIVRFIVEPDGRAYDIDVVSGLEPACDAAVVSALRDAWFIPGQSQGQDVPSLSQLAVRFRIDDRSSGFY